MAQFHPARSIFFIFFPTLNVSFADKLDAFSPSFTAAYYGIISTLQFIVLLEHNDILIVSDLQLKLLTISSYPFKLSLSPLVLLIK